MTEARMRASHMRSNLIALRKLGDEEARAIRSSVPNVVQAIDASVRTGWLPVAYDVELSEAVARVCGMDAFLEWSREAIYETARGPLLRPILDGLQRMGLGPRHATRRIPGGWKMIYRGCGVVHLREEEDEFAAIEVEGAPAILRDRYAHGIGAAFEAVLMCLGARDPDMGLSIIGDTMRYSLTWRLEKGAASTASAGDSVY